ncbi:small oligopeptide transporter [Coprinopsis marcescibilis]|uniref:Small oligopeptide transporter n=1 Tax=Coprinopsis marcescibilis TaxID=230819 RepID=A0A5C3KXI6_COPMA|nr:small oligopeptide transporter [Coprinopsis marcescibilis]
MSDSDYTLREESDEVLEIDLRGAAKSLEDGSPADSRSFTTTISGDKSDVYNYFDPNYDSDIDGLEDDSPYPEVRSAVANTDDPDMPASTLRAWILGILWAILIPGMNQFFYFRYPSVIIGGLVAQLLVFPVGRAWVRILPCVKIFGHELNPGPFTIKEHVLVTIMATVGAQSAYATDVISVQRVYYNEEWSFIYKWMLVMSTQLIGFSMGGIVRRFLVAPPSMIWPNTLVSCALFNTLHSHQYAGIGFRDGMSRERFFTYVFLAAGLWCIVPGYLFRALSVFTWVCWIAPNHVKINQLFGYHSGLGFSIVTFDWSQIAYIGSPLATPWWAEANVMIGFFLFYWILTPILYYANVWHSEFLPISSIHAFDNRGERYNHTRIINSDGTLNIDAYNDYSPLYLSTTFVMSYGLSFLSITATITHAVIYFWKPIRLQMRRSLREQPDVHARLMSHYPQVPGWYYACIFAITFTFACVCTQVWPTGMPIWALIIALLISLIYVIPIGMIQAITNRQVGLNVITELIVGYLLPGRPNAMMIFKTYGYITMGQAMQFTADFKLGHYMKVPPRPMFWCQVVATIIAGTVQLGVQAWMFHNIPGICRADQKDNFVCASTNVFGTASVIWGLIGPAMHFSKGQVYYAITFFFAIGAGCPILLWLIAKRFPRSALNYLNFPLIFAGVGNIPPATAVNFVPWAIVGFVFQYIVRRKHFSWWTKYNYVLSAALDAGTAIGLILIYFCLQYPLGGGIGRNTVQTWWGNRVYKETMDWKSAPLRPLSHGETFGQV